MRYAGSLRNKQVMRDNEDNVVNEIQLSRIKKQRDI